MSGTTLARRLGRRATRLVAAPVLVLATGACFATRQDVATVQSDLLSMRADVARADSARARELGEVSAALRAATDSLRALGARNAHFQGDAREALRGLAEQLIQVQELTGQSQRRIQELRSDLERTSVPQTGTPGSGSAGAAGPSGTSATPGDSAAGAAGAAGATSAAPGPNQLFQIAQDQLRRGSFGTARAGFQVLLRRYPNADVAPDAQFYVAETYAGENNAAAADQAYGAVVTKYPSSPRAATATFKRAQARAKDGKTREATALYEEVVRRWPRSDEAVLAREALRAR